MKKITATIFSLLLILGLFLGLFACSGGGNGGDPSNGDPALAKVKQAFEGVERSMTPQSSTLSATVSLSPRLALGSPNGVGASGDGALSGDPLEIIMSVYTADDLQATADPEPEYDQPPMVQFQYLKAIFEEMGEDYELGTKYYYDIAGQIYLDPETGHRVDRTRADAAEYLYNYLFGFAMSVSLGENDLIFAEVSFNIALTHGATTLRTSWYVSFDLDYDFNKSAPTYTLAMYTDNEESALAYLNRPRGYEYDYVQVTNGRIDEWRKFDMDADDEILIDEAHPNFASYVREGLRYRVGTCKWLKNGQYRKVTRMTDDKQAVLAGAFVDGMGLNGTAIGAAAFFAKSGKQNPLIDTYYKTICRLYGDDVLYDLVCKKDGSGSGGASSWASAISGELSALLPTFASSSATFSVTASEEGTMISVANANSSDFETYAAILTAAGFLPSESEDTYCKVEGDRIVLVALRPNEGAIFVGVAPYSSVEEIELEDALPYDAGDQAAYNIIQINKASDLEEKLVANSEGLLTTEGLNALIPMQSYLCEITLDLTKAPKGTSAEAFAESAASLYGAKYMSNGWTTKLSNRLNYRFVNGKDVLVLISSGEKDGAPVLRVYVLYFEKGGVERMIGGSNGTVGGGEGSGGGSGTNGGTGSVSGGGKGEAQTVTFAVCTLDQDKKILQTEYKSAIVGEEVDLSIYAAMPSQKVYLDADCLTPANKPVRISTELTAIYLWTESSASAVGRFLIYDVAQDEEEDAIYADFECPVGETEYYGFSFQYVVYRDRGCSDQVPLTERFTMTEEGITLYRKHATEEDYFTLNVILYLNGDYYYTDEQVFRKGKVYFLGYDRVIDFWLYRANYDQNVRFYLGEDQSEKNLLSEQNYLACTADVLNVCAYASNRDYVRYEIQSGGKNLGYYITNDFDAFYYSEGMGNSFCYGDVSAEYCTLNGRTITLHNTTKMNVWKTYTAWNGRILCRSTNDTYFLPDAPAMIIGDVPGEESGFYYDVNCTDPVLLGSDPGYEEGVYFITSSITLYQPYMPY